MDATKAIQALAHQHGISIRQARADMIVAIHHVYITKNPWFTILFGNREPSPEEFINKVAEEISLPTSKQ